MENIENKQTPTKNTGDDPYADFQKLRIVFKGKHMSAAIVVCAGAFLLVGGSFIGQSDPKLFVQFVGCLVGAVGLVGWYFSSVEK